MDQQIVPVPVHIKDKNLYLANFNHAKEHEIRIAYIGRAVDWKMYPVKKIIDNLSRLNYRVRLYIYTNDKNCFTSFLGDIPANLEVIYKVGYWGESLENDLMLNSVSLGYSMGTAALDMAKLGIPTILADFSYGEFPQDYNYRVLHNAGLGNLGENAVEARSDQRLPLAEILKLDRLEWSELSFNFVREKHSIDSCASRLITATGKTFLQASNIPRLKYIPYFLYYLYKRIFKRSEKYFGWGIM